MFGWFKKKKKNEWCYVNKFWGGNDYKEELVKYPDTDRVVELGVVDGNVSFTSSGWYQEGEWWNELFGVKAKMKITVVAWRECK